MLLAVTNPESMDGTTSGAIMVGSGANLGTSRSSLTNSSSPVNYTVPTGFTPPLGTNGDGTAKYTVTGTDGRLRDNGPSRLNMAKQAIRNVLSNYGTSINFGLYGYKVSNINKYTWVYHMSDGANANFGMTNTAGANTVANPVTTSDLPRVMSRPRARKWPMWEAWFHLQLPLPDDRRQQR